MPRSASTDERGFPRFWDEDRETLAPAARAEIILERIQHQLRYVYEELPFYRKHYDEHGFHPSRVRSLEDFTTKVPVISKKLLVADQAANPPFGSYAGKFSPGEIARIHGSSGTSGTPTFYAVSKKDWDRAADVHAMAQWCAGIRPDDTAQIGFPFGLFFGGWGVLQGLERIGATVFPLGVTESQKHLDLITKLGSTVFSATPSYCIHLLSVAEKMGIDLKHSTVRRVLVGGEPGGSIAGTRKIIEAGWGAIAVDAGSASEMYPFQTNVGCEAGTGTHLINDEVFTEVVHRDDLNEPIPVGERGAVVYTHLWRESQPMIRFAPGDESYLDTGICPCGRTYPRLPEGVIGRLDDMLVIRGANVYPSAIEAGLRAVAELGPEFRIHVCKSGALDELTVHAELSARVEQQWRSLPDDQARQRRDEVIRRTQEILKQKINIRVPVRLLESGSLEETTFKARRVVDERPKD
jgi:phenylacetate-CoA ligase